MSIIVSNFSQNLANLAGAFINTPEQRLIQGITGLPLQTAIDAHNNSADKETKIASVSRTTGKVIAGTLTGVLIRYFGIYVLKHFTNYKIVKKPYGFVQEVIPASKYDIFMPHLKFDTLVRTEEQFKKIHSNFVKSMGTFLATAIMMYTNFAVDAPLTRRIDQKIKPYVRKYIDRLEAKDEHR